MSGFEDKKPTLIFLCGPTGSGKTKLLAKTLVDLKIFDSTVQTPVVDVQLEGIDELIENNTVYKHLMFRLLYKFSRMDKQFGGWTQLNEKKIKIDEYNEFLRIGVNEGDYNVKIYSEKITDGQILLTDYATAIYFFCRDRENCPQDIPKNEDEKTKILVDEKEISCNTKYDKIIYQHIERGDTFAIETNMTRGFKDILLWYASFEQNATNFKKSQYNVVFSFVYVEFCENIKRIESRLSGYIEKFLNEYLAVILTINQTFNQTTENNELKQILDSFDDKNLAILPKGPRLPETDYITFSTKFQAILESLKETHLELGQLNRENNQESILIYDNNEDNGDLKKKFDSREDYVK